MMPLCTTAILPVQSVCGCAFSSLGRPCVAQRVCPMPTFPATGTLSTRVSQVDELADSTHDRELIVLENGHTRRVVAAVFKTCKPAEQHIACLPRTDISDDSTHRSSDLHVRGT